MSIKIFAELGEVERSMVIELETCLRKHLACNSHGSDSPCEECRQDIVEDMKKYLILMCPDDVAV